MTITVTQLGNFLKAMVDSETLLYDLNVEGEVSNLRLGSEVAFFVLKDDNAQINCFWYSPKINFFDGDKVVVRRKAFEIGIDKRWQRINNVIAIKRERFKSRFKIADFIAALYHFPARAIHLQQLCKRTVIEACMSITQRLNTLFIDADE